MLEVVAHRGVDRRGRRVGVADLFLDETLGVAELDQVGDVGVAEAVQGEHGVQSGLGAQPVEPFVEVLERDPIQPLGDPQRRMVTGIEQGSGLFDPLAQAVDGPVELGDGQHRAPAWDAALDGLAVADVDRAVGTPFAHVGVRPKVGQLEAAQFGCGVTRTRRPS